MKVIYNGKTIPNVIYKDIIYEAISADKMNYRIKDDSGHKNIYPKSEFKEIHIICKARYTGKSDDWGCINGNIYDITAINYDIFYEVIDETRQTYMYQKNCFEIIPNKVNIVD